MSSKDETIFRFYSDHKKDSIIVSQKIGSYFHSVEINLASIEFVREEFKHGALFYIPEHPPVAKHLKKMEVLPKQYELLGTMTSFGYGLMIDSSSLRSSSTTLSATAVEALFLRVFNCERQRCEWREEWLCKPPHKKYPTFWAWMVSMAEILKIGKEMSITLDPQRATGNLLDAIDPDHFWDKEGLARFAPHVNPNHSRDIIALGMEFLAARDEKLRAEDVGTRSEQFISIMNKVIDIRRRAMAESKEASKKNKAGSKTRPDWDGMERQVEEVRKLLKHYLPHPVDDLIVQNFPRPGDNIVKSIECHSAYMTEFLKLREEHLRTKLEDFTKLLRHWFYQIDKPRLICKYLPPREDIYFPPKPQLPFERNIQILTADMESLLRCEFKRNRRYLEKRPFNKLKNDVEENKREIREEVKVFNEESKTIKEYITHWDKCPKSHRDVSNHRLTSVLIWAHRVPRDKILHYQFHGDQPAHQSQQFYETQQIRIEQQLHQNLF